MTAWDIERAVAWAGAAVATAVALSIVFFA